MHAVRIKRNFIGVANCDEVADDLCVFPRNRSQVVFTGNSEHSDKVIHSVPVLFVHRPLIRTVY